MTPFTRASALVLLVCLIACGSPNEPSSLHASASDGIVEGAADDELDLPAARQVLVDYFEFRLKGQERQASDFLCNRSDETSFSRQLESFGNYRAHIADPLADAQGDASISIQLLTPENANLSDGTAYLERIAADAGQDWCIRGIALQPPPVPLSGQ